MLQITPISCGLIVDNHIELLNEDYKPTNNIGVVTLEIIMDLQTPGLPRKVIHFHCGFSIEFCGYFPEGIIVQNILPARLLLSTEYLSMGALAVFISSHADGQRFHMPIETGLLSWPCTENKMESPANNVPPLQFKKKTVSLILL